MVRAKKNSVETTKSPSSAAAAPKVVKRRGRPPKKAAAVPATTPAVVPAKKSKITPTTEEGNGNATQSSNGFYNDEETWIEIYYSLLEDARTKINNFRPPPMVEIVLCFNAFFQGYKEPQVLDPPRTNADSKERKKTKGHIEDAHAVTMRPRKTFVNFRTYAWQNLTPIVSRFDDIPPLEHEDNINNEMYRPLITPALLASVVSGERRIADLVWQDAQRDARPWLEKATARLSAREDQFEYVNVLQRHSDTLMNTQEDPWTDGVWNPDGIIKVNESKSYQMVGRHEHAAIANGLLFAAAVPPLGFNGDLRELRDDDFDEVAVRAARNQMLTDEERRQRTVAEDDEWVGRERDNHEENVALMVARRRVAEGVYGRIGTNFDEMMERGKGSGVNNEVSGDTGNGGDSEKSQTSEGPRDEDEDDEDYNSDAMDID